MAVNYTFYSGTSRGTLLSTSSIQNDKIKFLKREKPSEVTSLVPGRSENELLVGYDNGTVSIYDCDQNIYTKTLKKLEGTDRVTGIGCTNNSIIIARHDGIINIWNGKLKDYFSIDLDEKGTLDAMVYNSYRDNIIGTGGQTNPFQLWDVETRKSIFQAKSLGHDELNLPIHTSIRGITFFQSDPFLSACATKEGHVLLYDDRAQRKPIIKFVEPKASYTTISSAHRERQCLVGTTRGYMQLLDLKANKCTKTFTSFTGSVTSITCDPVEPFVISASLDRFIRVHNLETKELVFKVYMKQSLTNVLVKPIVKNEAKEEESEKVVDEEYEEIFNNMESVDEVNVEKLKRKLKQGKLVKKKRKTVE